MITPFPVGMAGTVADGLKHLGDTTASQARVVERHPEWPMPAKRFGPRDREHAPRR